MGTSRRSLKAIAKAEKRGHITTARANELRQQIARQTHIEDNIAASRAQRARSAARFGGQ